MGADTLGQKSVVTRIGYYNIVIVFYSYIGNQWSLECGRINGMDGYEIDDHIFVKDGTPFLNYGPHMRLLLIRKLVGNGLDINALKGRGLRGNIQGPRRVEGELLGYIEKQVLTQQ